MFHDTRIEVLFLFLISQLNGAVGAKQEKKIIYLQKTVYLYVFRPVHAQSEPFPIWLFTVRQVGYAG